MSLSLKYNPAFTASASVYYGPPEESLRRWSPVLSLLRVGTLHPVTESFGQRMRRLRDEQGYSVADLAAAVGASEGTIRQLESGTIKSPSFLLGIRIADQLKVDPKYLAAGNGISIPVRFDEMDVRLNEVERRLAKLEQRVAALPSARR